LVVDRPGGAVELEDWLSAPHVVVSRRGRLRDRTDELLGDRSRTVVASVASTSAAIEIVRGSDAVVVVPRSVALRAADGGDVVLFTPPVDVPAVPVVLSWHRRLSTDRGHAWLRELVRQTLVGAD